MIEKQCIDCHKIFPLTSFYVSYRTKKGKSIYKGECIKCNCLRSVEWGKKNKEGRRSNILRHCYGIDLIQYQKMLEKQNGVCAICSRPPGKRRLAVDHCHKTGKVRGLLCPSCNHGLGNFQDNLDLMKKAMEYLN